MAADTTTQAAFSAAAPLCDLRRECVAGGGGIFVDVADIHDRFRRQQLHLVEKRGIIFRNFHDARWFSVFEQGNSALDEVEHRF